MQERTSLKISYYLYTWSQEFVSQKEQEKSSSIREGRNYIKDPGACSGERAGGGGHGYTGSKPCWQKVEGGLKNGDSQHRCGQWHEGSDFHVKIWCFIYWLRGSHWVSEAEKHHDEPSFSEITLKLLKECRLETRKNPGKGDRLEIKASLWEMVTDFWEMVTVFWEHCIGRAQWIKKKEI